MVKLEHRKHWWSWKPAHSSSGIVGKGREKESGGVEGVCCDCPSLGLGADSGKSQINGRESGFSCSQFEILKETPV